MRIHVTFTPEELTQALKLFCEDHEIGHIDSKLINVERTPAGGVEFDLEKN